MLMKQHSYAFYNGHLSTVYRQRLYLLAKLEQLERVVKWEVDALADELRGTARDASKAYPNNLTFLRHYKWIPLPTVVYEIEYPQTDSIDWAYVAEKTAALVGVIFVMIQVSQYAICAPPSLGASAHR